MGKEQDNLFYDEAYNRGGSGEKYFKDPEDIKVYFEIWKRAKSWIEDNDIKSIVDFGCGPGHFSSILDPSINYIGCDFSRVAINLARIRNAGRKNTKFIIGNLSEYIKVPTDSFYTGFEFFEHVSFDLELMEKLDIGDKLMFSVPNHDSQGHVRFFNSVEDVEERYSRLFELTHIHTIEYGYKKKIFLYYGERI